MVPSASFNCFECSAGIVPARVLILLPICIFGPAAIAAHQCPRDKHEETVPASKLRFKYMRLFRRKEHEADLSFRFAPTID